MYSRLGIKLGGGSWNKLLILSREYLMGNVVKYYSNMNTLNKHKKSIQLSRGLNIKCST